MRTACLMKDVRGRKTVAELLVDVLVDAGIERGRGFSRNSLNGIADSAAVQNDVRRIGVRHEETPVRRWRYPSYWKNGVMPNNESARGVDSPASR